MYQNTPKFPNFVLQKFCEVCFGRNFPYRFLLRIAGVVLLMQGHTDSVVSGPDGCFQSRCSLYFSTAASCVSVCIPNGWSEGETMSLLL